MNESNTHELNMEPLKEVKEEVPDGEEDKEQFNRNNMKNVPIPEASTSDQGITETSDSAMLEIYEELLSAKKHNFQLEQRIQKLKKRPVDAEETLKDAEEKIRATSHFLKEQSIIIDAQAQRIKEYEKKDKENEGRMKSQLAKFEEILGKMTASDQKNTELFDSSSGNQDNLVKDSMYQFQEAHCEKELKMMQHQLKKLTDIHEKKLETLKNEMEKIGKRSYETEEKMQKELRNFGEIQKNTLEKMMKDQLSMFLEDFKKPNTKESRKRPAPSIPPAKKQTVSKVDWRSLGFEDENIETAPLRESAMRRSIPFFAIPPPKKKAVILKVKEEEDEQKQIVLPQRDVDAIYCVFCDNEEHNSADCTIFSTCTQRTLQLKQRNMCLKCLQPNNNKGRKAHEPCPKAEEPCSYCMERRPGIEALTHHHLLVCPFISSASRL